MRTAPELTHLRPRSRTRRLAAWASLGVLALAASSCSVRRFAAGQLGDALAESGPSFARDDDPELIREAAPFSLKLMESLLVEDPRHEGLLLAAARGFTQYGYAFVQQDAERLEEDDLERSRELRVRARKLYRRARDYGLAGLEVRHAGFSKLVRDDPERAAPVLQREDVPLLYWTGVSWGLLLSQSKDDPEVLADQPSMQALIDRALELDEGWNRGALHVFLIAYEESRPGGRKEWEARARAHFERALELSGGKLAAPYVAFAEAVPMKTEQKSEFEQLLERALAIDPSLSPDDRLENELAQARARWLRSRIPDLFLE